MPIYLEKQLDEIDAKYSAQQKIDFERVNQEFEKMIMLLRNETERKIYDHVFRKVGILMEYLVKCLPNYLNCVNHFSFIFRLLSKHIFLLSLGIFIHH